MNIKNYLWNRWEYLKIAFSKDSFKYGINTFGIFFPLVFIIALLSIPFLKSY